MAWWFCYRSICIRVEPVTTFTFQARKPNLPSETTSANTWHWWRSKV